MTDELGREELLEHLGYVKYIYDMEVNEYTSFTELKERVNQAYKQIKALIQKPGVTEEWIDNFVEEKAKEAFSNLSLWDNLFPSAGFEKVKDFIRKIVEEINRVA